ncbi:hypothetical protein B566_EDAN011638 [Ephemera danica]|nr:hypothetical protein B566_EDAN011638 [Ephemera danica]
MKHIAIFPLLVVLLTVAQAVPNRSVRNRLPARLSTQYNSNERIVGGTTATPNQFPYQVGIFLSSGGFCGGTLIKEDVILTAGHCAEGIGQFECHFAAHSINNDNEANRVIVTTRNKLVHAMWTPQTLNNDIALLFLPQTVSGPGIEIMRLPSHSMESDTFEGAVATFTGWGRISQQAPNINPQLKYANLTVTSDSECVLFYGATVVNGMKICTDSQGGTTSPCVGDFGGPLVVNESDGLPTEIGIASFMNVAGCEAGPPAGFTRVTSYLGWIEFNAGVTIRP